LISRRQFAIAYAVALVPCLALAIGQPVWSRVDEAAHYDVIAQYAAGVYPRDATTTLGGSKAGNVNRGSGNSDNGAMSSGTAGLSAPVTNSPMPNALL